jgi:hypothetical protein
MFLKTYIKKNPHREIHNEDSIIHYTIGND